MRLQQAKPQDQQKPKVDQQGQHKRGQPKAPFAFAPATQPSVHRQRAQIARKTTQAQAT
jgi:hypothetical protein